MGSYYRHLNDIQGQLMAFEVKNVGKVMALIENISDDEDVVKVVRCKDCEYYRCYGRTSLLIDGKNKKAGWCQRRIRYDEEYRMLPDDYCSYGVRKECADNG